MNMTSSDIAAQFKTYQDRIETVLDHWLPASELSPTRLHESMRYSVLEGGKRVRPLLVYAAGKAMGAAMTAVVSTYRAKSSAREVGKALGFEREQIEEGWLVNRLGNTYSGASPIGLTATLDVAKPGDPIFMCSYGSGAGSDAFVFTVQDRIREVQDLAPKTRWLLEENTIQVEYGEYAKMRRKIRLAGE